MVSDEEAASFFAKYELDDVPRFSDPNRRLYAAFDLHRGSLWQLLGPSVWWRGAKAFFAGHLVGRIRGDGMQLPGTFILHHGQLVKAFRNATSADRPSTPAWPKVVPWAEGESSPSAPALILLLLSIRVRLRAGAGLGAGLLYNMCAEEAHVTCLRP